MSDAGAAMTTTTDIEAHAARLAAARVHWVWRCPVDGAWSYDENPGMPRLSRHCEHPPETYVRERREPSPEQRKADALEAAATLWEYRGYDPWPELGGRNPVTMIYDRIQR